MAKLSATSSLDGYDKEIGTIRLREISNQSLIAMAIPLGEETKFKNSIKNIFGLKMPSPNKSVKNKDTRIFSTQPDQIFVLTKRTDDPEKSMAIEIGKSAYITDQTDAWVILEISGWRKGNRYSCRNCILTYVRSRGRAATWLNYRQLAP